MSHRRSTSLPRWLVWSAAILLTTRPLTAAPPSSSARARGDVAQFQVTGYTVAAWPSTAVDPSAPTVGSSVTHPADQVTCGLTKLPGASSGRVRELRWDDPADASRDCALPVATQFASLPTTDVKVAVRAIGAVESVWSLFTAPFTPSGGQVHACDGPPATSATVQEGSRTLEWCWNELDANGNPTTATAWHVTIDGGAPQQLGQVTVGQTANAQGKKLHFATIPLTRGTRLVRVAATNAQGQAVFSAAFTVTVTAPLAVPSVAEIRGVR